ncbi:hypothetical protein BOW39_12445 [Solemya velum gill symbiont]|uniref:glycosyltransferase family 61 protein n=1 Tax=Solemya velum gill symbiont TaxID=2340 RepID=UPI0009CE5147|nr:glycosyltransferase family 61 protein [Solemya velum gill symbiont]OOZ48100.1 hypothetical protein BOW39_12445 [Solemya velum gill symbiont]OOZ69384.1 hypothetical protein BOW48_12180 [Solemya velum gill symbiont]OOZ71704.1 hypothetical protein BOW49_12360 [Solemya velum gill symbiont]OOZ75378.1 hypothetical protein BOW50_11940 [Solemya velum gill symbiont]
MEDQNLRIVKDAILLPVEDTGEGDLISGTALTGGILSSTGVPIEGGGLEREYPVGKPGQVNYGRMTIKKQWIPSRKPEKSTRVVKGKYIFAGYLFTHYGHCLLDSLSRLWLIKHYKELPLLWLGVEERDSINEMHYELFDLVGIHNEMETVKEQIQVEELVFPDPDYVIANKFTKEQAQAIAIYPERVLKRGKKVWLSRRNLASGRIINEEEVEDALQKRGWIIFVPEKHRIKEQLEMLCDAERIAGIDGSAFHTLIFFQNYRGRIDVFRRCDRFSYNLFLIASTLKQNLFFHSDHYADMENLTPGLDAWKSNSKLNSIDKIVRVLD